MSATQLDMFPQEVVCKPISEMTRREKTAYLVQEMNKLPQTECPVVHRFAPGVYIREIFMPAGTIVIGKIHKTEHFNIVERGVCVIVHDDDTIEELRAPLTFVSKAGVQKVLYIEEDTVWKTVHVTTETDPDKLEAQLIEPPPLVQLNGMNKELLSWHG